MLNWNAGKVRNLTGAEMVALHYRSRSGCIRRGDSGRALLSSIRGAARPPSYRSWITSAGGRCQRNVQASESKLELRSQYQSYR
jgi:hypothetical protein